MAQLVPLFPTPFMIVPKLVTDALMTLFLRQTLAEHRDGNVKSGQLSHTKPVQPDSSPSYGQLANLIAPHLEEFGFALFGERLGWSIKEMWVNVLEHGGSQSIHSHANSFVSGVVYMTPTHSSARTVFHKPSGGADFTFSNFNSKAQLGPFNAIRWTTPEVDAGDMVLFPSYMLHEVPVNEGGQRITMAFNAIPDRLDSWGYAIRFSR